jgi:DNA repair protein RadC
MHRIQDIPESDRPRERLLRLGTQALSDAELLALFINTGTPGENALQIGQRLLREQGSLRQLSRLDPAALTKLKALGPAKAAKLAAAFELGRRCAREASLRDIALSAPVEVFEYIGAELQALPHESVRLLLITSRLTLLHAEEMFRGTLNECSASPRELLRKVLAHGAHGFVLVHNHPSGDPMPSEADRRLTRRLRDAAQMMDLLFQDHLIIGTPSPSRAQPYFSFREHGLL